MKIVSGVIITVLILLFCAYSYNIVEITNILKVIVLAVLLLSIYFVLNRDDKIIMVVLLIIFLSISALLLEPTENRTKHASKNKYKKIIPIDVELIKDKSNNTICILQPEKFEDVAQVNSAYCDLHKIDYIMYKEKYSYIQYINHVMNNSHYEYIIYLSPTCCIVDFDKNFQRIIQQAGDNDMILCRDENNHGIVSMDAVIFRNSEWSKFKLHQLFWDGHSQDNILDQIYTDYRPYSLSDVEYLVTSGMPCLFSGICIYNENVFNSRNSSFIVNGKYLSDKDVFYKECQKTLKSTNKVKPVQSVVIYPWAILQGYTEVQSDDKSKISIPEEKSRKIPKIIFQTMETTLLPKEIYDSAIDVWRKLNPEHKYYYFDSLECRRFIKDNFDDYVYMAYDKLLPGAYKSDLWRYCILYKYGGCYADSRTVPYVPLSEILEENDHFCSPIDQSQFGLWQGFLCSSPRHEYLKQAIDDCARIVLTGGYNGALGVSGPDLIGRAVNRSLGYYQNTPMASIPRDKINAPIFYATRPYITNGDKILILNKYTMKNTVNTFEIITGKEYYGKSYYNKRIYKFPLPSDTYSYTDKADKGKSIEQDKKIANVLFSELPLNKDVKIPEKVSIFFNISSDDVVLQISDNNSYELSVIISGLLSSPENLVVVSKDSDHKFEYDDQMIEYKTKYGYNTYKGSIDVSNSRSVSFSDLQRMFNITFDTLVLDCGDYENILNDAVHKGWMKGIRKIVIVYKGKLMEDEMIKTHKLRLVSHRPHDKYEHGVRVYTV